MTFRHISLLRSLCLLGVIGVHCMLFFATPFLFWKLYAPTPVAWVDAVAGLAGQTLVPSFIFASGFTFAKTLAAGDRTRTQILSGRARRLLLPWLAMALFWLAPLYTLFDIPAHMRPAGSSLAATYQAALLGVFVDHLWFLLALFWTTLFWWLVHPWLRGKSLVWGALLALGAALLAQRYGAWLPWYCLGQTANPIICFFVGMAAFQRRQRLDALLRRRPLLVGAALAAAILLLTPHAPGQPALSWLVSVLCCLAAYLACLLSAEPYHARLRAWRAYAWLEDNGYRMYLFHMPIPLLGFMWLHPRLGLPPLGFILLDFAITLAVTALLVVGSRRIEPGLKRVLASLSNPMATKEPR